MVPASPLSLRSCHFCGIRRLTQSRFLMCRRRPAGLARKAPAPLSLQSALLCIQLTTWRQRIISLIVIILTISCDRVWHAPRLKREVREWSFSTTLPNAAALFAGRPSGPNAGRKNTVGIGAIRTRGPPKAGRCGKFGLPRGDRARGNWKSERSGKRERRSRSSTRASGLFVLELCGGGGAA
jgi:hypothetical protein